MRTLKAQPTWLVVLLINILQLWVAGALISVLEYCCDAGFYLATGRLLINDGLLAAYAYDGHRSYLAPILIYGVHALPFADWLGNLVGVSDAQRYGINAFVLFWLLTNFVLMRLMRRQSLLLVIASAFVWCNPILLAHLVVPLQESALLIVFLPVFLLLIVGDLPGYRLALGILLSVYAYMVRESYAFIALPLMLLAIVPMLGVWTDAVRPAQSKLALCVALLISIGLVAPQSWRNHSLHGDLAPYHSAEVQSDQLLWGAKMYRYSTEKIDATWHGFQYLIPEQFRTAAPTLPAALLNGESLAISSVLNHMAVGLIHDSPGPYVAYSSATSRRGWALLSTAVVVLGGFGMFFSLRARETRLRGVVSMTLLALSLGYTAFVAAETRFGILGFAALSIGALGFFQAAISVPKKMLLVLSVLPIYGVVLKWLAYLETTRQML